MYQKKLAVPAVLWIWQEAFRPQEKSGARPLHPFHQPQVLVQKPNAMREGARTHRKSTTRTSPRDRR